MRKIITLLLTALTALTASAADYPSNGYYRVQNRGNGQRYITLIDNRGHIDYTALNNSDLYASRLRPFETSGSEPGVVDDPGSIFFATQVNTGEYNLAAQGTSVSDLASGIYLHLGASGNANFPWIAYGMKQGVTVYICGSSAKGPNGTLYKLGVGNQASGATFHWAITPVTATGDNYFGLIPDVTAKGVRYKAFYAAFPFKPTTGMSVYYVTKVDKSRGLVVWDEISGTVPSKTPVIVRCAGAAATDNRLDLQMTSPAAISGNQLKGVFFSNNEGDGHTNYVAFNAATMRVLGTCSDGSLGYVAPAGLERIPANSSYLVVGEGAPAEMKLVTQKEYEEYQAVTITAKSYTRLYGDDNPTFEFTASGTYTGTPEITCEATKTSPVGTYPIVVKAGTVQGQVTTVDGTLTITQAPVTVTAKSYEIVETEALPAFEAAYSGWKNGEDESVLTKRPTLACNATADKAPGEYTITVSGAEADNYTFTYTDGKLTITQAPTITVKAEAKTMVYGDEVPELTYTVEGGTLTGTPSLSTTATGKSDVGEYAITVGKGSISYPRLVLQGATLTVTKAMLTVNAGSYTMKQNEQRPAFKAIYSGWKNGDTEAVLTKQPTLTTDAPADNAPGTYKVTAAGAEATNYDFDYKEGQLVITAADAITIVATDASMVYGDEAPQLQYTISGGTVTGTPLLTCEATKTSDAGEYVIKVEKGTVDYPNLVLVNGTLTVTQAPVTVTAKSYEIVETEALPAFEAAYSGWKNGEDESVLTKRPTLACNATADKAPGEYTITVSGAEADNYTFTYTDGKLTITQAPTITVKAEAKTMVYGDEVPELTYTVEGGTLTGTPSLSTTATGKSDVGEYAITVGKGSISYPRLVLQGATLTVTKAMLTVTAADATRLEGEENPQFTLTYEGFKNGDTEDVLTTKPVATTVAGADSAPGTYAITVGGGEARNYDFTYVGGTLTVKEKPVIITIDDDDNANTGTIAVDEESGTAEYIGVEPQDDGEGVAVVEIPETVTVTNDEGEEEEIPVTKIAESAFEDMTTIETVVIPSTIEEIGADAFKGCTGLKELYVYVEEPIDLTQTAASARGMDAAAGGDDTLDPVFDGVDKETCVLYVPFGCKDNYKAAPVWGTFKNICEMEEQGIDGVAETAAVRADAYSLSGVKVGAALKSLPTGIYVVEGKKILVK